MKRLLAAGSGDIFQICKAFRQGEAGRHHNPEFTLLEWYRVGWDHTALMREVAEFLGTVLNSDGWQIWPYRALFVEVLGVDLEGGELRSKQVSKEKWAAPPFANELAFGSARRQGGVAARVPGGTCAMI